LIAASAVGSPADMPSRYRAITISSRCAFVGDARRRTTWRGGCRMGRGRCSGPLCRPPPPATATRRGHRSNLGHTCRATHRRRHATVGAHPYDAPGSARRCATWCPIAPAPGRDDGAEAADEHRDDRRRLAAAGHVVGHRPQGAAADDRAIIQIATDGSAQLGNRGDALVLSMTPAPHRPGHLQSNQIRAGHHLLRTIGRSPHRG